MSMALEFSAPCYASLSSSGVKTSARQIKRPDEQVDVVRLKRCTVRRIIRLNAPWLVPVALIGQIWPHYLATEVRLKCWCSFNRHRFARVCWNLLKRKSRIHFSPSKWQAESGIVCWVIPDLAVTSTDYYVFIGHWILMVQFFKITLREKTGSKRAAPDAWLAMWRLSHTVICFSVLKLPRIRSKNWTGGLSVAGVSLFRKMLVWLCGLQCTY